MTSVTDIRQLLVSLRQNVDRADQIMMKSATVSPEVAVLVNMFADSVSTHVLNGINPYSSSDLWHGAYRAAKGLGLVDYIELRTGLNLMLDAIDELIDELPFSQFAEIPDVLKLTSRILSVNQQQYADLLGVSTSTLRRWQNGQSKPNPQDDAKIRFVGKLASQLSYTLTQRGIYEWLYRHQYDLRQRPIDTFNDPTKYDEVLALAESFRSMSI